MRSRRAPRRLIWGAPTCTYLDCTRSNVREGSTRSPNLSLRNSKGLIIPKMPRSRPPATSHQPHA
eukprot:4069167-Pyramimonas_sp.AAC.1